MSDTAALERVRAMAERWAALEGDTLDVALGRRIGAVLVDAITQDPRPARARLEYVRDLAEHWLSPGATLFYPAAGQAVLDAIKDEGAASPVTITKGDIIRIIPDRGPERVMVVTHVEQHIITLAGLPDEDSSA